jgi:hypothetical protein
MGVYKTVVNSDFSCGNSEKKKELNESIPLFMKDSLIYKRKDYWACNLYLLIIDA